MGFGSGGKEHRQVSLTMDQLPDDLKKSAFEGKLKELTLLLERLQQEQLTEEDKRKLSSLISQLIANTARVVIMADREDWL